MRNEYLIKLQNKQYNQLNKPDEDFYFINKLKSDKKEIKKIKKKIYPIPSYAKSWWDSIEQQKQKEILLTYNDTKYINDYIKKRVYHNKEHFWKTIYKKHFESADKFLMRKNKINDLI